MNQYQLSVIIYTSNGEKLQSTLLGAITGAWDTVEHAAKCAGIALNRGDVGNEYLYTGGESHVNLPIYTGNEGAAKEGVKKGTIHYKVTKVKATLTADQLTAPEFTATQSRSLYVANKGEHYTFLMGLGRLLPTTPTQIKRFYREGNLDVLTAGDVAAIERIMERVGKKGEYCYTQSKTWVRLQNIEAFKKALLSTL